MDVSVDGGGSVVVSGSVAIVETAGALVVARVVVPRVIAGAAVVVVARVVDDAGAVPAAVDLPELTDGRRSDERVVVVPAPLEPPWTAT